jgi:hypothetical protein
MSVPASCKVTRVSLGEREHLDDLADDLAERIG